MGAASKDRGLTVDERAKAIKAFEELGLATQLAEAAANLGWKHPSPIQQQAIPPLLAGE
jgi:ATP-dependent RNA helicase DDX47/RRP3